MLGLSGVPFMTSLTGYYLKSYFVVFLLAVIGATPVPKAMVQKVMKYEAGNNIVKIIEPFVMAILLILVTAYLVDGSFNPFLHFRF
jgi:alginate O-acetyltransferase complex protein AlgI